MPDISDGQRVKEVFESAPAAVQEQMLSQLVGQVYEAAPPVLRRSLLEHLMRPLGVLSLVAVGSGVFAKIRFRGGWPELSIRPEDLQDVRHGDVLALVGKFYGGYQRNPNFAIEGGVDQAGAAHRAVAGPRRIAGARRHEKQSVTANVSTRPALSRATRPCELTHETPKPIRYSAQQRIPRWMHNHVQKRKKYHGVVTDVEENFLRSLGHGEWLAGHFRRCV